MTTIDGILDNISIGNAADGVRAVKNKTHYVINVADPYENPYADLFIPLLCPRTTEDLERVSIPTRRLDIVAFAIHDVLQYGNRLMVHCTAGLERSPLSVMWYFYLYWKDTIDASYELTKRIRPQLWDRRHWISYVSYDEFCGRVNK